MDSVHQVKHNKAFGADDIPSEFWKSICLPGSPACNWILHLFNSIWTNKQVPESWHIAKICAIFKKGDVSDCGNYMPISLLNAGYKLFALILLNRLRSSSIDYKLLHSQFGFKRGAKVSDAIFVARRFIDKAFAEKDGRLVLLALDWAKAFDAIMPEPMFTALSRFGLPTQFIKMVRNIYSSRSYFVHDHSTSSSNKSQSSGISQGRPLSPV